MQQFVPTTNGMLIPAEKYPNCPYCQQDLTSRPAKTGEVCPRCKAVRMTLYDVSFSSCWWFDIARRLYCCCCGWRRCCFRPVLNLVAVFVADIVVSICTDGRLAPPLPPGKLPLFICARPRRIAFVFSFTVGTATYAYAMTAILSPPLLLC